MLEEREGGGCPAPTLARKPPCDLVAFALPELSCIPFFSPFKILKGILPGRRLPVRGVLSCPGETSFSIVPREGFNRFLLVVGRHPKHQKTVACPEKGLLAQCLPVACPLPPSCLPASLGPAKMVRNALGRGSKGEVRGERRWEGGQTPSPAEERAHHQARRSCTSHTFLERKQSHTH